MTFQQELASWNPFKYAQHAVQSVPQVGSTAPSTPQLVLPRQDKKPVVAVFLRHCGCPFAEKIFLKAKQATDDHPNIHFVALSHSDQSSTEKWLQDIGGAGKVEVVVDDQRQTFSAYGLSLSSYWAVLNPWSLTNAITIGKKEGIDVRPTESGSRWQEGGLFAVDSSGQMTYSHKAHTSDDLGDLEGAIHSVEMAK